MALFRARSFRAPSVNVLQRSCASVVCVNVGFLMNFTAGCNDGTFLDHIIYSSRVTDEWYLRVDFGSPASTTTH